jgi:hypothetical protein
MQAPPHKYCIVASSTFFENYWKDAKDDNIIKFYEVNILSPETLSKAKGNDVVVVVLDSNSQRIASVDGNIPKQVYPLTNINNSFHENIM